MAVREKVERLLLAGVDTVEAELARDLLGSVGIPALVTPVGYTHAAYTQYQGGLVTPRWNVFVPGAGLERARAVLREAWDPAALDDRLALETPAIQEPLHRSRVPGLVFALVMLCALIAILYFGDFFSSRPH